MKIINKGVTLGILIALAVPALAVTNVTCPGGGAPATLATPGTYQLTSNLACTVAITSSSVTLKLNGWTITPPSGSDGIDINVSGGSRLNHVTVQGPGLIRGLGGIATQGINIQFTDYSLVEQVTIVGTIQGPGLFANANTFLTITSNVVSGAGPGIYDDNCTSCVVSWNDASGNTYGITDSGFNNTVNNNTANGNRAAGISIPLANGTRVYGNITNGNGNFGITVEPGVQIFSNISSQANGIYDMFDDSKPTACSGSNGISGFSPNYWSNNVFQTANSSCIH